MMNINLPSFLGGSKHDPESKKKLVLRKVKGSLFLDVICSFLMIWGLLIILQQLFRFDDSLFFTFTRTAISLLVIVLISRNKIVMAVVGGIAVFSILVLWVSASDVFKIIAGYFKWWMNKFPTESVLNTKPMALLSQVLISLGISLVIFFLVRVVRRFSFLLLLQILAFGVILFNGFKNDLLSIVLFSAGSFPVLAQEYQVYLYKKEKITKSAPIRIMAASTAVCLVASVMAGLIIPKDTVKWQNRTLAKYVPKFNIMSPNRSLTTSDFGLSNSSQKLGGNISLDDKIIFEVSAKEAHLYRASHFDSYTGSNWVDSDIYSDVDNDDKWIWLDYSPLGLVDNPILDYEWLSFNQFKFRSNEGLFPFLENSPFDQALAENEYNEENLLVKAINETKVNDECEVVMKEFREFAFVPGQPSYVMSNDEDTVGFNAKGEITMIKALSSGDSYFVNFDYFDREHEDFETLLSANKQILEFSGRIGTVVIEDDQDTVVTSDSPKYFYDGSGFTSFDDSIRVALELQNEPSQLVKTAVETALGETTDFKNYDDILEENRSTEILISDDYNYAAAIEGYLKNNFTYTTSPGNVPKDTDFVDHFLSDGKGYCTYFASAMAVMCRSVGIPARYVIGHGVRQAGKDRWTAHNDTGHAWVEAYIHGVGWITFDPTAGSQFNEPDQGFDPAPQEGRKTTTKPVAKDKEGSTTAASGAVDGTTLTTTKTENYQVVIKRALIVISILLMVFVIFLLYVFAKQKFVDFNYLTFKYNNSYNKIVNHYYKLILKQLKIMGITAKESETIKEHLEKVLEAFLNEYGKSHEDENDEEKVSNSLTDKVTTAFIIVERSKYSKAETTLDDAKFMSETYKLLNEHLKETLSKPKYFLKRYFW